MFHGSMVALVTPMYQDGSLDEDSLHRLIEFHLENNTDAIVAVGTTGESPTLDFDEHCYVIRRVVEAVKGRVPVIGGTGSNSTSEAIALTRCAMEAGADACLLVTPYYNKPTQEGLYLHHEAVAKAVAIPQILYNVPGRTACDMLPETVARLADISNIIGIKEASGKVERVNEILERCGDKLDVYSGEDVVGLEAMLNGAKGVISVTSNVVPRAMHNVCIAALTGNSVEARALNEPLMPLHRQLFAESNPIPVKWALHEMGLVPPGIRLPLTRLSQPYHEGLRNAMKQAGAL